MKFKTKVILLASGNFILLCLILGSYFFAPERRRSELYTWLREDLVDQVDRILIAGRSDEAVELVFREGSWKSPALGGQQYLPVKQARVEDLLASLSKKAQYPVRAKSASSHERLSLTTEQAERIVLFGGANQMPLLDLLIGATDAAGGEIYLRKNSDDEVRSGEDIFTVYTGSRRAAWYNLRLFQEPAPKPESVQRIRIQYPPDESGSRQETVVRDGQGWRPESPGGAAFDAQAVNQYVRTILGVEGDDFDLNLTPDSPLFSAPDAGRLVLEFEDGSTRTLSLGPQGEDGKRPLSVSGAPFVYTVAEWTAQRLFPQASELR